jgi:hypothetical protein
MDKTPRLFHIGTVRVGSTYLYHLLANHNELTLQIAQEIGFYSNYFDRCIDWYKIQFHDNPLYQDCCRLN